LAPVAGTELARFGASQTTLDDGSFAPRQGGLFHFEISVIAQQGTGPAAIAHSLAMRPARDASSKPAL
jgi:hypothetical protein